MKNKSSNHKSTNRFKFTTFADRVSAIDVRHGALYHLEHANAEVLEGNETYFYLALQKWKVLNLTKEYLNFSKKVENIVTLPQLVHKQDEVVDLLIERLEAGTVLALQPLLEFVVVLAKDLQEDFYQYFPRFLKVLIKLLNTKDAELLEWTLICLAFLFKSLRVYLKRDILVVFDAVLPLLSDTTPWYVSNFAAESFAFVARDIKDKKKFLQALVKSVKSNSNGTVGCGRLLFEVIRGVGNHFHSCTSSFLNLLFETLGDKHTDQATLFEIITQTVGDMLQIIHPKNSETFWTCLWSAINLNINSQDPGNEYKTLEYLLRIMGQVMEHEKGNFVVKPVSALVLIVQLLDMNAPENIYKVTSQLGVLILTSEHTNLPQENAVSLVKRLLSIPYHSLVLNFVQEVVMCTSFDMIVLPHFIASVTEFDVDTLTALSKICLTKAPLCKSGIDLYSWVKYPIDFTSKTQEYSNILFGEIQKDVPQLLQSPDNCVNAMICLPHIKRLNIDVAHNVFKKIVSGLIEYLKKLNIGASELPNAENTTDIKNALFILAVALECTVHTVGSRTIKDLCSREDLMDVLLPHVSYQSLISLRIMDLYFTVCHRELSLEFDLLESLHLKIGSNLISPFHEVRLFTTHLYSLFEELVPNKGNNKKSPKSEKDITQIGKKEETFEMFSLCHSCESITPSISDYRDQLVKLSRMSHGTLQYELSNDSYYKVFGLKYAIGFLHINFKLLWEPLQTFILGYANGMPINEFWEVFYPSLLDATKNATQGIDLSHCESGFTGKNDFLTSNFTEYFQIADKPDFSSYRIRLWEILYQASNVCETKNRDITPLFLEFLKAEFEKPQQVNVFENEASDDEVLPEAEQEDEAMIDNTTVDKYHKRSITKSTYETVIAYLKIYSNIQNPKAMYKEETLKRIYLEFLMHKNPILQKIALDCIMRYKNKHLTPYKENLYNLVDGKKFKDELRTFKLEAGEEGIPAEDRNELIPIILRIAFSKMITNTGIDKKGGSQMRRSLVMRFLSGCEESELMVFTNMAFMIFEPYMNLETNMMKDKIVESLSELVVVPPKRLLGSLNLVDTMREQFTKPGQEVLLLRLLKVVLCIGIFINGVLCDQQKIKKGYASILKDIRNRCTQSVVRFFQQFENFEWDFEKDILPIYEVFVWPAIEKLPIEGIHSPTPLLKLFDTWSQFPRYHPLLNVVDVNNSQMTPLPFFFQLLVGNKLQNSVNDMSLQILERLLTFEVDENEKQVEIPLERCVPIRSDHIERLNLTEKLNFGTEILLPHVTTIVEILKKKMTNINFKKLQKRELVILSRVTEIVIEPTAVDNLVEFSLPILIHRVGRGASEDTLEASICALNTLLSKSTNPRKHIRLITPLFSKVALAGPRRSLCRMLDVLATDDSTKLMALIISDMNAPDEKWLEQPDYEKRLKAYKQIYQSFDENKVNAELGAMIIHNCFFAIHKGSDMSLRNTATACLHKITPKLILMYKDSADREFLIRDTILLLIRNCLKVDNDILKVEGTSLLGELVRQCADAYPTFKELLPLTNVNKEIDFFENLQHLQFHRKIRALQRFSNYIRESPHVPSFKTLTQFIVPIASQFVCTEKYVPQYALVDAAIEVIGCVCHLLPWRQYEAILKFYVGKQMRSQEYQKQTVKLVSAILDAFHFDLSKADVSNTVAPTVTVSVEKQQDKEAVEEISDELEVPDVDDDSEESVVVQPDVLPYNRMVSLSPSLAKRVISTITEILNQLDMSSNEISEHETSHTKIRKGTGSKRESEEKLKLPLALAIIKLLQKLPQPMLKNHILSVFMKVCNFLKSPMIGVRASAREILCKIMLAVGSSYLGVLLSHLSALLQRGIHVHVLISTVHTILITLKDSFNLGEMDKHLFNIMKVCVNDLFGKASEEKEVIKIGNKTPEAKPSAKSFSTLRIMAQNISEKSIVNLLKPFKDVAETSHSKRTILKVQTALQNISIGLAANQFMSIEELLVFLHSVVSETNAQLHCGAQKRKTAFDEREEKWKRLKPDCMLIAPDPRAGKKGIPKKIIRTSSQANAHVLVEFGLNLLYSVLQKEKFVDGNFKTQLNNIVPYLLEALKSNQVKVATMALKCLTSFWVKKLDLPTLQAEIREAASTVLRILHKYATSGLSKKDDNFHLVANGFKAVTALIRDVKYYKITPEEMKVLLLYAEHDIHDSDRQATAFTLFKAIIAAHYDVPQLPEIMMKVANLSVLSESARTRDESRQVMLAFIMNYPLEKKVHKYIQFYITQLAFELEQGRTSSIKMLHSICEKFSEASLKHQSGLLYISLGERLVNESSVDCRIQIADCIEVMLNRLPVKSKNELFDINVTLFNGNKPAHTEMTAQLCTRFVNVEKLAFKQRLEVLLPIVAKKLFGSISTEGRFVRNPNINLNRSFSNPDKDNAFIQVLDLLNNVAEVVPVMFSDTKYQDDIDAIAGRCQALLAHPHSWVRYNAAKFLIPFLKSLNTNESGRTVFHSIESLKSLTLDLSSQFVPGAVTADVADIICSNLLVLIQLTMKLNSNEEMKEDEHKKNSEGTITEFWVLNKLKSAMNSEVTKSPGSTVIRMSSFKMLEELLPCLKNETVFSVVRLLLPCIAREMTKTDANFDSLKLQAERLGNKMSECLGDMAYNELLTKVQGKLSIKRQERKQKIAQEKIINPEKAAKRRETLKKKKIDYKKKKLDIIKGRAPSKGPPIKRAKLSSRD